MSTGPKSGWGGKRDGAGRHKQTLSMAQIEHMFKRAKFYEEKNGKSIDDVLLDFIYSEKTPDKDKIACIKLWKEYTIAKMQEGGSADSELGPNVYLPSEKPDPAKVLKLKQVG